MKLFNIEWDTDGEYIADLPTEVEILCDVEGEDVTDYLSDIYGFCVFGYEVND